MSVSVGDWATVKTWVRHVDGGDCILLCSVSLVYLVEVWLCKKKTIVSGYSYFLVVSLRFVQKHCPSASIQSFSLVSSTFLTVDLIVSYSMKQHRSSCHCVSLTAQMDNTEKIRTCFLNLLVFSCVVLTGPPTRCCYSYGAMPIINLYYTYNSYCYTMPYNYIQILIFVLKCCLDYKNLNNMFSQVNSFFILLSSSLQLLVLTSHCVNSFTRLVSEWVMNKLLYLPTCYPTSHPHTIFTLSDHSFCSPLCTDEL